MVQPRIADQLELVLGVPRLPMLRQRGEGDIARLQLSEGILVDDSVVTCLLEDTWRYPWLKVGSRSQVRAGRSASV